MLADALDRIRAFAAAKGWKRARLAAEAKVSDNVTRSMGNQKWLPSSRSILRLEAVIPADWRAGDPVPAAQKTAAASAGRRSTR